MPIVKYAAARRRPTAVRWICYAVFAAMLSAAPPICLAKHLITFDAAAQHGLRRAWFAQVQVDSTRHQISQWTLHGERLYALTTAGMLHAMDANTGKTLWVVQTSPAGYPCAGPAVNANRVAVVGGSSLYVLDSHDGHLQWSRSLGSASGVAPALSERYAFVATLKGRIEGYVLDSPSSSVWQHQSEGHIFVRPVTTGQVVAWFTDRRLLYVADANTPRILFRTKTVGEVVAAPMAKGNDLYAAALDGYLYCLNESSGAERWRYSTGLPITQQPAVVGARVFVASEEPVLHAVDVTTGSLLWRAHGIVQFAAQGAGRVYGTDRQGALVILDGETGATAGRIATAEGTSALANDQSDRIYLVNNQGLVQCLHEIGANEPTRYRAKTSDEKSGGEHAQDAEETVEPNTEESPATKSDSPAQPGDTTDDANVFDDSNPFGQQ